MRRASIQTGSLDGEECGLGREKQQQEKVGPGCGGLSGPITSLQPSSVLDEILTAEPSGVTLNLPSPGDE